MVKRDMEEGLEEGLEGARGDRLRCKGHGGSRLGYKVPRREC